MCLPCGRQLAHDPVLDVDCTLTASLNYQAGEGRARCPAFSLSQRKYPAKAMLCGVELTADQLKRAMPGITPDRITLYLPFINSALNEFEINTPLRIAAFLAQVGHESGSLRWMEEIWGPTPAQKGYEGRRDLGNTQPGDGSRYRGRGPIQITGRANYRTYGDLLGFNLVADPEMAATKELAFRIAGAFWKTHELNEMADRGEFERITRKINGGLNGQPDRLARYSAAKAALESSGDGARRTLKKGDSGPDVEALQRRLGIKIDGKFGDSTLFAVREWQAFSNLKVDGVVGPKTWESLFPKT